MVVPQDSAARNFPRPSRAPGETRPVAPPVSGTKIAAAPWWVRLLHHRLGKLFERIVAACRSRAPGFPEWGTLPVYRTLRACRSGMPAGFSRFPHGSTGSPVSDRSASQFSGLSECYHLTPPPSASSPRTANPFYHSSTSFTSSISSTSSPLLYSFLSRMQFIGRGFLGLFCKP
jgi:hypothetical protein